MYNVVDDLSNYYDNKKADYEKFCQEITKPFEIPPVIDYQLEDNYKKRINSMANQIANYRLNIQNDTEVIYNLLFQRDFLLIAINQFLTKTDHNTKQLFINILNKIKADKEADEQYKEKFWRWVNQENFSANLLWEVKNHDKIEHNPILNFPIFS